MLENAMVVDWYWGEQGYGVPLRQRSFDSAEEYEQRWPVGAYPKTEGEVRKKNRTGGGGKRHCAERQIGRRIRQFSPLRAQLHAEAGGIPAFSRMITGHGGMRRDKHSRPAGNLTFRNKVQHPERLKQ